MKYRVLGRTGLKISEIGLGSWQTYGNQTDDETAAQCIRAAFDAGVNFFDSADIYSAGKAEETLGRSLRDLPRGQIVIATKCRFGAWPGPLGAGLSRKHIFESVEGSLRRLAVDYIDLYQTHYPDKDTPADVTLRALDDLMRQGKILHAGCSNYTAAELAETLGVAARLGISRFESLQPEYSMLFRHIETQELPFCARNHIGVISYSPLAEGVLTGKYKSIEKVPHNSRLFKLTQQPKKRTCPYLTAENLARVRKLAPIARKIGCTPGQLAIAWVLRRPEITTALTGASRPEQLAESVKAVDITLDLDTLAAIEKALANKPAKPW